jgi:hypothetical protein
MKAREDSAKQYGELYRSRPEVETEPSHSHLTTDVRTPTE